VGEGIGACALRCRADRPQHPLPVAPAAPLSIIASRQLPPRRRSLRCLIGNSPYRTARAPSAWAVFSCAEFRARSAQRSSSNAAAARTRATRGDPDVCVIGGIRAPESFLMASWRESVTLIEKLHRAQRQTLAGSFQARRSRLVTLGAVAPDRRRSFPVRSVRHFRPHDASRRRDRARRGGSHG